MEWLETHPVFIGAITFLIGAILAGIGNYFFVSIDIAFIKGQLSEILKSHDSITDVVERYAKIDLAQEQIHNDFDGMELRMKFLESKLLNGRHNG